MARTKSTVLATKQATQRGMRLQVEPTRATYASVGVVLVRGTKWWAAADPSEPLAVVVASSLHYRADQQH